MSNFSSAELLAALGAALAGRGMAYVDAVFDGLEAKYPDAKNFLEAYRSLAHLAAAADTLAAGIPAAVADAVTTLKTGSGPVDTAGGMTI